MTIEKRSNHPWHYHAGGSLRPESQENKKEVFTLPPPSKKKEFFTIPVPVLDEVKREPGKEAD